LRWAKINVEENANRDVLASRRRSAMDGDLLRDGGAEDQRDREAVKLGVRGLGHDAIEDLVLGMRSNPLGDRFAENLTVACLGRRKHLETNAIVARHLRERYHAIRARAV
jgi:hypothetical protein